MKTSIIYKEEGRWYVGNILEYPDYESQGKYFRRIKEKFIGNI